MTANRSIILRSSLKNLLEEKLFQKMTIMIAVVQRALSIFSKLERLKNFAEVAKIEPELFLCWNSEKSSKGFSLSKILLISNSRKSLKRRKKRLFL